MRAPPHTLLLSDYIIDNGDIFLVLVSRTDSDTGQVLKFQLAIGRFNLIFNFKWQPRQQFSKICLKRFWVLILKDSGP